MLNRLDLRGIPATAPLGLPRPDLGGQAPVEEVRALIAEVRRRGDSALRELTRRFDGAEIDDIAVPVPELDQALDRLPEPLRQALCEAHDAIEAFHRHRGTPPSRFERGGIAVELLEIPVARAGCYVPGGRARYPSTVLMTAIPARVAGVGSVACCVPPGPDGRLPDEVLAAAALAGVDEVFRVGGVQAIAALAYGTETIRPVDVVCGPGSKWVSLAQAEVRGVVGVPASFAGPSEVVVVADGSSPAVFAAIDVIVQAEHGPDGLAWLVTWSEKLADEVAGEVERLLERSPRQAETRSTLERGGHAVVVDSPQQAMRVANEIAPEHLELLVEDPEPLLRLVRNAGAVFLGLLSPASVGDYLAGPSHVLPTFGSARFASVLGVEDFLRRVHAVQVDRAGIERVAPHVAALADAEGLAAHAESVRVRVGAPGWSDP